MFDCFFGWRKASKCKKLVRRVQWRLKLLKTKRQSIVKQLRDDVAHLIKVGYQDLAFKRAEHLVNDETVLELYELLENFCDFIISHLSYFRKNKDCPNDINEAVSTLIFASARCGDIPELRKLRKLFRDRYGQRFETTALELLPGNLVNLQVKEKLSFESVPDDMKMKLLDEIAKDNCFQTEILAIEFASEFHQQMAGSCDENPNQESDIYQDDTFSTTVSPSIIEQCPLEVIELESSINSFEAVCTKEIGISRFDSKKEASSSESLPRFQDEIIVYLDDIEEVKHCNEKDGNFTDQRVFKFKSPVKLRNDTKSIDKDSFDMNNNSLSDSDSSRKRIVNTGASKSTKRRSKSRENFSVKDIHCMIYYDKPHKNAEKRRNRPYWYKQSEKTEGKTNKTHSFIVPNDASSKTTSPLTRKEEKPLYMRAMTMPQERSKESYKDNFQRSASFPIVSPNHVHPKLPDYDEIAAKFTALKEEHKQNQHN